MVDLAATWTKKRLWWVAYAARHIAMSTRILRACEPDLVLVFDILGSPAIGVLISV